MDVMSSGNFSALFSITFKSRLYLINVYVKDIKRSKKKP